jgi:hypothetical protein
MTVVGKRTEQCCQLANWNEVLRVSDNVASSSIKSSFQSKSANNPRSSCIVPNGRIRAVPYENVTNLAATCFS